MRLYVPFDSTRTIAPKPHSCRRCASMASASTERQTLPSDSSSTRTGPGFTPRAAASSFAAVREASCQRQA